MKYIYYQLASVIFILSASVTSIPVVYATPEMTDKTVRYVNDRQVVRIRSDRTGKGKILASVSSGMELVLLGKKGKYSQVRTIKGATGWMLSIYLRKTPIARVRLKNATKLLKQANRDIKEKDKNFTNLGTIHEKLKIRYQELEREFTHSQQENQKLSKLASEPIKLANKNKQLSTLSVEMTEQVNTLQMELTALRDDSNQQWFLYGAGVVLLGVLLGILLPKLRPQQKSSWSNY